MDDRATCCVLCVSVYLSLTRVHALSDGRVRAPRVLASPCWACVRCALCDAHGSDRGDARTTTRSTLDTVVTLASVEYIYIRTGRVCECVVTSSEVSTLTQDSIVVVVIVVGFRACTHGRRANGWNYRRGVGVESEAHACGKRPRRRRRRRSLLCYVTIRRAHLLQMTPKISSREMSQITPSKTTRVVSRTTTPSARGAKTMEENER